MSNCYKPEESGIPLAKVSYHPQKNIWFLTDKYSYSDDKKSTIILDECFSFDLSSIPRLLWIIVGIHELSLEAPLIHDFMYMSRGGERKCFNNKAILGRIKGTSYSRKEADDLFLKMMKTAGVSQFRRRLGYIGVRIFGAIFWRPEWLENFFYKPNYKKVDECQ
ncbi:MAG: DUF1353 domain-containing protein [Cyanobacteria bacterium P01_A01_bin.45]